MLTLYLNFETIPTVLDSLEQSSLMCCYYDEMLVDEDS